MHTCTRRLEFDAGHRVLGHQGKCRHLHGHRYAVEITCYAIRLNQLDMVVDFGKIKELVGEWIDKHLDHNVLLNKADPLACFEGGPTGWQREDLFGGREPWVMQGNPTAENIAVEIFSVATRLLNKESLVVQNVRVFETPNCWADYPGPPTQEKL